MDLEMGWEGISKVFFYIYFLVDVVFSFSCSVLFAFLSLVHFPCISYIFFFLALSSCLFQYIHGYVYCFSCYHVVAFTDFLLLFFWCSRFLSLFSLYWGSTYNMSFQHFQCFHHRIELQESLLSEKTFNNKFYHLLKGPWIRDQIGNVATLDVF